ncbi:TPA: hypothetical protein DEP96_01695 [Candidatus Uhrbacteria bacterium]|nr:hypothetical protein [Candidatus Uhrbacteria bacterium]
MLLSLIAASLSPALAFSGVVVTENSNYSAHLFCELADGTLTNSALFEDTLLDDIGGNVLFNQNKFEQFSNYENSYESKRHARSAYYDPDPQVRDELATHTRVGVYVGGEVERCVNVRGYFTEQPVGAHSADPLVNDHYREVYKRFGFSTVDVARGIEKLFRDIRLNGGDDSDQNYHLAMQQYFGEKYQAVIDAVYPVLADDEQPYFTVNGVWIQLLDDRNEAKRQYVRYGGYADEFRRGAAVPDLWSDMGRAYYVRDLTDYPVKGF